MLTAGDTFGSYRVERVLGEGGFATVYLAEDVRPAMSRRVALKVLDDRFVEDEDYRERFTRESRLAANLDHPNVAPIYDAGELDGRLYIAMRFIDGVDLKERLAQGELSAEECVAILRQIGSALDDAHGRGLIHRDVKPGNVLLDGGRADRVYLADFGITKEITDGKEFTQAGTFLGTLSYASPEQLEGRALDGRSDQYALACLLYECLTGRPPFSGSLKDILSAHLALPAPKVTSATDRFPRAIDAVVARGMAKAPEGRYASCSELAEAAAAALVGAPAASPDDDVTGETVILGTGLAAAAGMAAGVAAAGPDGSDAAAPGDPVAAVTEPTPIADADAQTGATGETEAAPGPDADAAPVVAAVSAAAAETTQVSVPEAPPAPPSREEPPPPPRPTPSTSGGEGGGNRTVAVLLGLVAILAVGGLIAVLVLNNGSDDDAAPSDSSATLAPATTTSAPATTTSTEPPTTTTSVVTTTTASVPTFTGTSQTIQPIRTLAPASVPDNVDGCGVSRVYGPQSLVDDDLESGWAMDGDGEGQRLRLNLGGPTRVNQVAITPGLAEPSCSSLDIFDEQRRLQSVRWVFSDGTDVQQTLDPSNPGLQSIDVDVVTSRVTAVLGRTVDGGTIDVTAVAEIRVEGVLADPAP